MGSRSVTASPLPFSALVGQEPMKLALLLNAINPAIGGVLIRGERGTAKSTAVRALARLLPEIEVIRGCRYNCSPADPSAWCDDCRQRFRDGATPEREHRRMRVVELPLNASEDRVVGSIDLDAAVRYGEKRFAAGVLAQANRNILYVDEVNLLDDHLVDVLLDAAAMGRNTVEREGVSVSHPSRFILVGTMNPEEGQLRPQLTDRFGLCVDVVGLRSLSERVQVLERVNAGDDGIEGDAAMQAAMVVAAGLLSQVAVPPGIRRFSSMLCLQAGASGHRADVVLGRTAATLRAWRSAWDEAGALEGGSPIVTAEDVIEASDLVLSHRRSERAQSPAGWSDAIQETRRRMENQEDLEQASSGEDTEDTDDNAPPTSEQAGEGGESGTRMDASGPPTEQSARSEPPLYDGSLFAVKKIQLPRTRRIRKASGKRSPAPSADRRGRYVGSTVVERPNDVALDATVRTAAPHQQRRRAERPPEDSELALYVEPQDIRQKVRRRRTGTSIVFVVDASASMDAEQRMHATKGAILSLLRDAYVRRDKVSLVVFSGRTARIVLHPTNSVDLAEQRLHRLAVGGTTPLTHGLAAGLKLVQSERLRDPGVYSLLVLISDGRGNISLTGAEPLVEARQMAARLADEKVRVLIIDSARDNHRPMPLPRVAGRRREPVPVAPPSAAGFNPCQDLADRSGGEYLGLFDLSQGSIVDSVARTLRHR